MNKAPNPSEAPEPDSDPGYYFLRLYVAGQTAKSMAAIANLKRVCETHLAGRYEIETIDLLKTPQLAAGDQILAIPTLVRRLPTPLKKHREGSGWSGHPAEGPTVSGELKSPEPAGYRLRLVVAGSTERSRRAIENLRKICSEHLDKQVDLEVIDIFQQPELAEKYQVVAAPTLVKLLPPPIRRIIGDLSQKDRVLRGLDIAPL